MKTRILLLLLAASALPAAEKIPTPKLLDMAAKSPDSTEFREAAVATLTDANIKKGTAIIGEGPDFLWLLESSGKPILFVDDERRPAMKQIKGTPLWLATGKLATGTSHNFFYIIDGKKFGGNTDVAAY